MHEPAHAQCLNLDEYILIVHDGKGLKDRSVPLPRTVLSELLDHIEKDKLLHDADLEAGFDGVFMPRAFDKKSPGAAKEFAWQWLFPAKIPTFVPETNERRRYHLHDTQNHLSLDPTFFLAPKTVPLCPCKMTQGEDVALSRCLFDI
jgi:hypothetical protein